MKKLVLLTGLILLSFLFVGGSDVLALDFKFSGCTDAGYCDEFGNPVGNDEEACGEGYKMVCGYDRNGNRAAGELVTTICSCLELAEDEVSTVSDTCGNCKNYNGTFVAEIDDCDRSVGHIPQCQDSMGNAGTDYCLCQEGGTVDYAEGIMEMDSDDFTTDNTSAYDPSSGCESGHIAVAGWCFPYDAKGIASKLIQIILGIAGGTAFLLMVYGFILVATASGDEKKMQAAKETITSAIVGLLISLFALFLYRLIFVTILQIPGLS